MFLLGGGEEEIREEFKEKVTFELGPLVNLVLYNECELAKIFHRHV